MRPHPVTPRTKKRQRYSDSNNDAASALIALARVLARASARDAISEHTERTGLSPGTPKFEEETGA